MIILYILLLALIQGVIEFLPISSFGQLNCLEQFFGINTDIGLLLEVILHLGTVVGLILLLQGEMRQLLSDSAAMVRVIMANMKIYRINRRAEEALDYQKIVHSSSQKLAAMIWVSMIPTFLIGFFSSRLVVLTKASLIFTPICMLLTGIIMLVVDVSGMGGDRKLSEGAYDHAMWIGICQGISVFPGLSRCGLTICAGLICGYSRKFSVKYSYMIAIPAIIGSAISQLGNFASSGMTLVTGIGCILGMIVAAVVSYFTAGRLIKILCDIKLRWFSMLCFITGVIFLLRSIVTVQ